MLGTKGSGRTLLIASTGGHLEQLMRLKDRLRPALDEVEWVTFDDSQTRSLLAGEHVHFVPYVAPRSPKTVVQNLPMANRILRDGEFTRIVTTGSAVVLSFLPLARARGVSCHFIESAARSNGPSMTGSMVSRIPGMHLYSQYRAWADRRWLYRGSLFDRYRPATAESIPGSRARRVVVTFGTMRTYEFRRAAEALTKLLPEVTTADAQVLWQVGITDTSGLGIESRKSVPGAELRSAIKQADLVIAHAGVGSALTALDLGKAPVLLPRRQALNEMVDDHQLMIAGELDSRGLAISRDPSDLQVEDLERALTMAVTTEQATTPFDLVE